MFWDKIWKDSKGIFEELCKKKLWKSKVKTKILTHDCMKITDFSIILKGKQNICSEVLQSGYFLCTLQANFQKMILFTPGVFHNAWDACFLHNSSGANSFIYMHSLSFGQFFHSNSSLTETEERNCYADIHW